MSRPQRHSNPANVVAGERTFFVTSSTWDKRALLQSERAASLFVQTLRDYRATGKLRLHAFVVMPDHFHLLITVGLGITIERAVQLIKGGFAFRAGKELGFSAPVWQKGFSEIRVLGVDAFEKQKKYTHENPVRARLAATAQQFPYSSASGLFNVDPPPTWLERELFSAGWQDVPGRRLSGATAVPLGNDRPG